MAPFSESVPARWRTAELSCQESTQLISTTFVFFAMATIIVPSWRLPSYSQVYVIVAKLSRASVSICSCELDSVTRFSGASHGRFS